MTQGLIKKRLTDKQESFLTALFSNRGNISAALEEAGYSPNSRRDVLASLKDEIQERTRLMLNGAAVEAAQNIVDTMNLGNNIDVPVNRLELRYKAAGDVLDRVGITKRQQMEISGDIRHGIVLLPGKKPMVDVTPQNTDGAA
jgi:hypothetical protein|tara:strand:- start:589 stop:1017 length:429 start_codon:yes stop_codon:yes gene_type:complete